AISVAGVGGLERVGGREVGGPGDPREQGIAGGGVHGQGRAKVIFAAAEVGGPDQGAAGRVQPRHEPIIASPEAGLQRVGGREVRGVGVPRDQGIAGGRVHGQGQAIVIATAAEVGGEDQGAAGRVQPRHDGIREGAAGGGVERVGGREVGGNGLPRDQGVAGGGVHGQGLAPVLAAAAEVGGVDQGAASRVQPRHEHINETPEVGLERVGGRGGGGVGVRRGQGGERG